ncbi:unnamed protein product [Symbiodinium microadriaticum]|nr:unnamed protein product [Symbiodinium sp. KB8]CAE7907409.1 unnamed protein product [Symbiodinium microadriaticum]
MVMQFAKLLNLFLLCAGAVRQEDRHGALVTDSARSQGQGNETVAGPCMYFVNKANFPVAVSLEHIGPLHYVNVLEPGQRWRAYCGVVWFTVRAQANFERAQLFNGWSVAEPIVGVIGDALTAGVSAVAKLGTKLATKLSEKTLENVLERGMGLKHGVYANGKVFHVTGHFRVDRVESSGMLVGSMDEAVGLKQVECQLGCSKCGYNWYQSQWQNGSPSRDFHKYCGCCGGSQAQQDDCKEVCAGAAGLISRPTCELGCEGTCGYNWYQENWKENHPTQHYYKYCDCCGGSQAQQNVCKAACTS